MALRRSPSRVCWTEPTASPASTRNTRGGFRADVNASVFMIPTGANAMSAVTSSTSTPRLSTTRPTPGTRTAWRRMGFGSVWSCSRRAWMRKDRAWWCSIHCRTHAMPWWRWRCRTAVRGRSSRRTSRQAGTRRLAVSTGKMPVVPVPQLSTGKMPVVPVNCQMF